PVVAIAAAGRDADVADAGDRLDHPCAGGVGRRALDPDLPGLAAGVRPAGSHFAADLDQVAGPAGALEQQRAPIAAVALGDRREVDAQLGDGLAQLAAVAIDLELVVADDGAEPGDVLVAQLPARAGVAGAEAPGVDQWADGDVKGAAALLADLLG